MSKYRSKIVLQLVKNYLANGHVIFDNKKVFKSVWFALSTNMIEGWHPTVEDVERLREEAVALGVG